MFSVINATLPLPPNKDSAITEEKSKEIDFWKSPLLYTLSDNLPIQALIQICKVEEKEHQ